MPKLAPGQAYAGRRADVAVLNCSVDREAKALLEQYSGGGKKLGAFVSRLAHEYHVRQEERHRVRHAMQAVFAGDGTP